MAETDAAGRRHPRDRLSLALGAVSTFAAGNENKSAEGKKKRKEKFKWAAAAALTDGRQNGTLVQTSVRFAERKCFRRVWTPDSKSPNPNETF